MNRITKAQLDSLVARINHALDVPCEAYASERDANGGLIANAGTIYLASAYGGYRLEQMCKGGGSRDLLSTGYESKRHVYATASAYLAGLESRQ